MISAGKNYFILISILFFFLNHILLLIYAWSNSAISIIHGKSLKGIILGLLTINLPQQITQLYLYSI